MPATTTAKCVRFNTTGRHTTKPLPLPTLTDADIDDFLEELAELSGPGFSMPTSQFGRRVAVEIFLRQRNITPPAV